MVSIILYWTNDYFNNYEECLYLILWVEDEIQMYSIYFKSVLTNLYNNCQRHTSQKCQLVKVDQSSNIDKLSFWAGLGYNKVLFAP